MKKSLYLQIWHVIYKQIYLWLNPATESRFEITKPGELCSDIGKMTLKTIGECAEAARELTKNFGRENNVQYSALDCYLFNNVVFWNVADRDQQGSRSEDRQAICYKYGKCTVLESISVYQIRA